MARALVALFAACAFPLHARSADLDVTPKALGPPPYGSALSTQLVFLRASQPGSLKIASVAVEAIEAPDGTRFDPQLAILHYAPEQAGRSVPVAIAFKSGAFARPGTYKFTLRVQGQRTLDGQGDARQFAVDELVELPLSRPAAEISVSLSPGQRLVLERSMPGGHARLATNIQFKQDSGPPVDRIELWPGPITRPPAHDIVPGRIGFPAGAVVLSQGAGAGRLLVAGLERAGDFDTKLTFVSQNLARPIVVPVVIRVRDHWLFPLVVVTLGVFAGAVVRWLIRTWRPRQMLRYRLAELRSRLDRIAPALALPPSRSAYDRLIARIHSLENALEIGSGGEEQVRTLETDVDALQTRLAQVEAETSEALARLRTGLANEKALSAGVIPEAEARFAELDAEAARAAQALDGGRTEEAKTLLDRAQSGFNDRRIALAHKAVETIFQEVTGWPDGANKTEAVQKLQAAREALGVAEPDFPKLWTDLRSIRDGRVRGLRAGAPQPEAAAPQFAVAARLAAEQRRANSEIRFSIEPAPADVRDIRWTLGGARRSSGTTPAIGHAFVVPQRQVVGAEIEFRDGRVEEAAPLAVTILPSEAQTRARGIVDHIRRADWGLIAVAILIAAVSAMLDRYVDKPFGSAADYLWAFLWGFGIENLTRGFSAAFDRISTQA